MSGCFLCDKHGVGWDKTSLGFVLRQLKLCAKHKTELEQKLAVMPDDPVSQEPTITEPKFTPPPAKVKPDHQQRAAGDRDPGVEG
jgi:hypothetical protein